MFFGQVSSSIGCIGMLLSRSMWQLTASYVVMMLGASFAWGGILALVPQFVPKQQHGAVSGWVGLMSCAGTLLGAGVGFGTGTGRWSSGAAYYGCAVMNVPFKMRSFVFKMMNFALKTTNFGAGGKPRHSGHRLHLPLGHADTLGQCLHKKKDSSVKLEDFSVGNEDSSTEE